MVKMEASKMTSKTSSLKAMIVKAWRERWTDIQWGINIKTILPRGVSGDLYNLADCILQQAMVGCGANQLVMSYLKHSLASHLVSYAAVLQRISKFDAFHKPYCITSLLEFLESFLGNITSRAKMEEDVLVNAIAAIINWLLQVFFYYLSKYPSPNPVQCQELLEKSSTLLNNIVNTDFLIAMFFLAKQTEPEEYNEVIKKCQEISAFLMVNVQFKAPGTIHETLQKICNMDIDKIAPLNGKVENVSYSLQALLAVNVLANPSMDMQQLANQLIMVQKVKGFTLSRLYCELIRASFISLNDASSDASKQALWAAFSFLKVPQLIQYLHNMCGTANKEGVHSIELVEAFEKLLESTPLLDILDTKCSCNSIISLLDSLAALNVVGETHIAYFMQKRENKDLKLQKLEPTGLQGSVPSFITRAEPTLAGILKTIGGDFHKTQESLYAMLCQIVSGTTLDTILAVATVEGKLKLFVSRLIKYNEFALMAASEKGATQSKVYIFDISFLILCSIVQDYGPQTVLDDNGDSFFEQWVRECMPQKGVHKSPEQILQKCDPQLIDVFIHHLSAPDFDFKNTNLKPHDLCVNVPGVIKETLYAWEQGSLTAADVKRMLDSLRQKMACLSVCASVWLFSFINIVHQDGFLKPINMVQQFLSSPSETELTQIDNFKERALLMSQIIKRMQFDIHTPSVPKPRSGTVPSHLTISKEPVLNQLQKVWEDVKMRGYLHIDATHLIEGLLNTVGPVWFVSNLVEETLKYRYQDDLDRSVDIVFAMFHLDIEACTEALILHVLPHYLFNAKLCEDLVEPQSSILAKLSVYCIYAALEQSNSYKNPSSRKRRIDDSDDVDISNKIRRLNDNSSDSGMYSSYNQGLNSSGGILKEPMLTALECLFNSFSQLAGKNGNVTPQTHFIFRFLVYIIQCGQDKAQIVLQKMPSELVPTLIKALPELFNINLILRLYNLSTAYGRKDTARDLCLLRNMQLRPE